MTTPLSFIGIAGSLRHVSYSRAVLDSTAELIATLLPAGSEFDTLDIGALPHYNEDLEVALPPAVEAARATVRRADAVIIVTPEFNHGLPGVLKNTLDWLSRPAFTSCMAGKPVFFLTLSPGALGGVRAQYQLRETLASMLCVLAPLPEMAVTHVGDKVENGLLRDRASLAFIGAQLQRFLALTGRRPHGDRD